VNIGVSKFEALLIGLGLAQRRGLCTLPEPDYLDYSPRGSVMSVRLCSWSSLMGAGPGRYPKWYSSSSGGGRGGEAHRRGRDLRGDAAAYPLLGIC
jgi:hypothetical protein